MKRIGFLGLLGISALIIMSCSKNETSGYSTIEEIGVSSAPAAVTSYVSDNYPDATINTVLKYSGSDTSYAVLLNTYELIAFDQTLSPFSGLKEGELTDSIVEPPHGGGHHGGGHHGGGHHGGGHPGGYMPGEIPVDSLPAAILDYISANFAGYRAHNARLDTLCQFGNVIGVMIDSSGIAHKKLIFDGGGLFLASAYRVRSGDLPGAVTLYVSSTYPGYTIRPKAEQFTLADGTLQYKIFIFKDSDKMKLVLDSIGGLICRQ